jgi:hypothetical protein
MGAAVKKEKAGVPGLHHRSGNMAGIGFMHCCNL